MKKLEIHLKFSTTVLHYIGELALMRSAGILGVSNVFTIFLMLNAITIILDGSIVDSIINLIASVLVLIYYICKNKQMSKLLDEGTKKSKEILLKNIIKRKGLDFVKELKEEMYKKGVKNYGTNKKTRKKITKSI